MSALGCILPVEPSLDVESVLETLLVDYRNACVWRLQVRRPRECSYVDLWTDEQGVCSNVQRSGRFEDELFALMGDVRDMVVVVADYERLG